MNDGAFDDPAVAAQAGVVFGPAMCDLGRDAALTELATVAVGAEPVWPAAGPADRATHWRDAVEERDQLGAVVTIAAGDRPGKREPAAVYH